MHSFSFGEIALIFGIVVILFGGSRLSTIGKSLGEGIANFKKGLSGNNETAQNLKEHTPQNELSSPSSKTTAYAPPQVPSHTESSKTSNPQVIDLEQKEYR